MRESVPHGEASLYLAAGVLFLNEEERVFEAMLEGWSAQQLGGRRLQASSVRKRANAVKRFHRFTNEWPWQWSASAFDEWMNDLVAVQHLAPSTIRNYQEGVRLFCAYLCSEHYGWTATCLDRFGTHPVQVCHDWNTSPHLQDYEGRPGRRPLAREELQRLLDHADAQVGQRIASGRKGALPAYRDATLLKVIYAWGLRANEAVKLDTTDFYRNPHAQQFGRYGMLQVRHGKSSRGGPPKRRTVLTLFDWAVDALEDYLGNVRPLMRVEGTNALWVSERGTRLRTRELQERFAVYRDELGLDPLLSPHALRHSYVTHLIEDGVDAGFVQRQVGHEYASTTAIYTAVSADYANKMMARALRQITNQPDDTDEGTTT